MQESIKPHHAILNAFLIFLYCLHVYWSYLILRIAIRQVTGGRLGERAVWAGAGAVVQRRCVAGQMQRRLAPRAQAPRLPGSTLHSPPPPCRPADDIREEEEEQERARKEQRPATPAKHKKHVSIGSMPSPN